MNNRICTSGLCSRYYLYVIEDYIIVMMGDEQNKRFTSLPRRRLGKTELMVSVPALGGVGLRPIYGEVTEAEAIDTVHRAIERGINFIDTSPLYGVSEQRIGTALKTLTKEQIEDLIICTKVGDECPPYSNNGGHPSMSKEGVLSSVENSMKNLGVSRIDIILLHDPIMEDVDKFLGKNGGMEGLLQLREEGKIGYFGIGSVDHDEILRFMESEVAECSVYLAVNDYNLLRRYASSGNMVNNEPKMFGASPFAEAQWRDIGILNGGTYYMGLLADPINGWSLGFKKTLIEQYPKLVDLARRIQAWCEIELPKVRNIQPISIRTLALQFSLRHEAISSTVIGCRAAREVDEACDAYMTEIPSAVWTEFDSKFREEINALDWKSDHWRYNKNSSNIGNK